MASLPTTYHTVPVPNGSTVFYSAAGAPDQPVLLLLHGYPSSSYQYRHLLSSSLASTHRLIAPDLPGFGLTTVPAGTTVDFQYMATTLAEFLEAIQVESYVLYIFDFGAPAGLRLATLDERNGKKIRGVISQNGNMHVEGFGDRWGKLFDWWKTDESSDEHKETREWVYGQRPTLATTTWQYTDGVPESARASVDPYAYHLDYHLNLSTPEKKELMTSLFWDYRTNVDLYPKWQAWVKQSGVPVLAVWGKNDQSFVPKGAEQWGNAAARARVELVDGGHFPLETHSEEIALIIERWLDDEKL